jgi:hypothetical protein
LRAALSWGLGIVSETPISINQSGMVIYTYGSSYVRDIDKRIMG